MWKRRLAILLFAMGLTTVAMGVDCNIKIDVNGDGDCDFFCFGDGDPDCDFFCFEEDSNKGS